jgi:type VI protein secretion system component Hcp
MRKSLLLLAVLSLAAATSTQAVAGQKTKVKINDIPVTKKVDKSTPTLMKTTPNPTQEKQANPTGSKAR